MKAPIYEDSDYLVLNKEVRVHFDECLITQSVNHEWEPVHRIDFETSGLLLFSRGELLKLTRDRFQDPQGLLKKTYLVGASKDLASAWTQRGEGAVEGFIGSRYRSSKKVRFSFNKRDFQGWHSVRTAKHVIGSHTDKVPAFKGKIYQVELLTGARHQIRAYFEALDAPLVGDPLYGNPPVPGPRLELHSWRLEFEHPLKPGTRLSFEAPL